MRWTLGWWRKNRPPPELTGIHVRVYTRIGCHLCDDAWRWLSEQQGRHGFVLEARDVDSDAELAARYGEWVPVVMVNGQERFRGRVNPVLVTRRLRREAARLAAGRVTPGAAAAAPPAP